MDECNPRKKRARTSKSPDSDGDKRRGRPRVEKQDESAADRRRTQIRMAQRAYRQRKESTLEELRKRVSDLTNTIELMNRTFVDCRDQLYASNELSQAQFEDFYQASEKFEELVKDARNPDEDDPTACARILHRASAASAKSTEMDLTEDTSEPSDVPTWWDKSVVAQSTKPRENEGMDIGLGYKMYWTGTGDAAQSVDYLGLETDSREIVPTRKSQEPSPTDISEIFRIELPDTITLPQQLAPPATYSFQETTFGRRLHRACLESAYRLLLEPLNKPATYERIFRLSLMGRDRIKMAGSLKAVLDRGPHEALDFWQAPLIHVGGAGTHYPRRDP